MTPSRTPARVYTVAIAWIVVALSTAQLAASTAFIALTSDGDRTGVAIIATIFIVAAVVAISGFVGGIGLLLRKHWARTVLEVLTWACCGICIALGVFGAYSFVTWSDPSDRWVPAISMVGYPTALAALVPLLFALRTEKMRQSLSDAA